VKKADCGFWTRGSFSTSCSNKSIIWGKKSGCNKPSGDCIQGFSHASDSLMEGGAGKNIRTKN
jgi:hypothetical protein